MMPNIFTVDLEREHKRKNHTGHTIHRFQKDILQAITTTLQNLQKHQKKG